MKSIFKKLFSNKKVLIIGIISLVVLVGAIITVIVCTNNHQHKDDEYYTINYVTNCEQSIEPLTIKEGSTIDSLNELYKYGCTFLGWYYDDQYENQVKISDKVNSNITLYAKFSEETSVSSKESITFATVNDAPSTFSFMIEATHEISINDVLTMITCKNITMDTSIDTMDVLLNGDKEFIIKGIDGEFVPGCSYKFTLDSDDLFFIDYPKETRELSFNIYKEEVLNLQLKEDITYIKASSISNIIDNGTPVENLSFALINVSDQKIKNLNKGSFVYTETPLNIGDKVAIYKGINPLDRTLETEASDNGDIVYLIITKVTGTTYEYQNAEATDIIFKPDILPINCNLDMDGNNTNNQFKIETEFLDFSDDVFYNIGLDSSTTIDVGDYMAIYTDDFNVYTIVIDNYAIITSINVEGIYTIISYTIKEWSDVEQAMDIYAKEAISGEEMLEDVDQAELLSSIEESATESGFVDNAASVLASAALCTEGINIKASEIRFKDRKYQNDDSDVEINVVTKVDADLSTTLKRFEGYSGLRLKLTITATITIKDKRTNDEAELKVVGVFEQEVRLDIGVSSKAVWKVFGIIPYIAEYKVSLNIDLFDYTGFEIDATYLTKTENGNVTEDQDKYASLVEELKSYINNKTDENGEVLADHLSKTYEELLARESSWVRIVDKQIFKKEFRVPPCLPIIACEIGVDFVVETDTAACTGFSFHYQNAKRYIYSVSIFKGKVSNDVINIKEEEFDMTYYLIGKLKVRAGIEASFNVGLLSTSLDSIGFTAEAGAYLKCYGFFFYNLNITESGGKKITREGPFTIEIGAYIDVNFVAQALGGKYSTTENLVYNEYPFWETGNEYVVLDFVTKEEDIPEVNLKQYIRNMMLPDSLFYMHRQSLLDGKFSDVLYSDESDFNITITNPSFSYNPLTNMITVNPADGITKLEGDMIITYKDGPKLFTSKKLEIVIHLYWDNLRDGYVIMPYTNGGSFVAPIVKPASDSIIVPSDPVKTGYIFDGWFSDQELNSTYSFPEIMPESDTYIYAKWLPATDTQYTVEYYQIELNGSKYELVDQMTYTGTTDTIVTPIALNYPGFITPETSELTIAPDGSSIKRYYYTRIVSTITFNYGEVDNEPVSYELKYGAEITAPIFKAPGYTFIDFNQPVITTMGYENVEYTAQWEKNNDTLYRVEYYVQDIKGRYILKETINQIGETNSIINVNSLVKDDYIVAGVSEFANITLYGTEITEAMINGDGTTIIKVNYRRLMYQVKYVMNNNQMDLVFEVYAQSETPTIDNPSKLGFIFSGWDQKIPEMVTSDLTFNALYTANLNTEYKIEYYVSDADFESSYTLHESKYASSTQDAVAQIEEYRLDGTTYNDDKTGNYLENTSILEDGTRLIKIYFKRNSYTVTIYLNDELYQEPSTYNYGGTVYLPVYETKYDLIITGYLCDGVPFYGRMPNRDIVLTMQTHPNEVLEGDTSGETPGTYRQIIIYTTFILTTGERYRETRYLCGLDGTSVEVVPEEIEYLNTPSAQTGYFKEGGDVLYFMYDPIRVNVIWNYNGGEVIDNYFANHSQWFVGDWFSAPTLYKEGYRYTWDQEIPERLTSTEPLTFNAIWELGTYTVKFADASGNEILSVSGLYKDELSTPIAPEIKGYTFTGNWNPYTPTTIPTKDTTFTPIYEEIPYAIIYDEASMENATNNVYNKQVYYVTDGTINFYNPTKVGYTFTGWYLNNLLTGDVITNITVDESNLNQITLFASWTPNKYVIVFDNGLKASLQEDATELMTYDVAGHLDANSFINDGYTFAGWSYSPDGEKAFNDQAEVISLTSESTIRLYALWNVIDYQITYLTDLVGATSNPNVTTYNIEQEVTFIDPNGIKQGYEFLGWYNEAGTKVNSIPKGITGNKTYIGKWAHGGIFNLSYVKTKNGTSTYKVTRTISENTVASTNEQFVYYRTVNGTAIGGTAESINFLHVGGPNVFLKFTEKDTELTFEVVQENGNASYKLDGSHDYLSTAYVKTGTSLYYNVELYQVQTGNNSFPGYIGNNYSYKKEIEVSSSYQIDESLYDKAFTSNITQDNIENRVTDDTNYGKYEIATIKDCFDDQNVYNYLKETIDGYYWALEMGCYEYYNGDQFINFTTNTNLSDTYQLGIGGTENTWWDYSHFPLGINEYTGFYSYTRTNGVRIAGRSSDNLHYNSSKKAFTLGKDVETVKISFAAGGDGEDDWLYRNVTQIAYSYDESAPVQIGVAPLAFGKYQKNDKITISVVYNEIIGDVNNLSVDDCVIDGLKLANFKYINGVGSNVLVFEATVQNDFEITPDFNNTLIHYVLKIKGQVKDMLGN